MSLTITDKGGNDDFPKLEKGMYEGTLYSIVDISLVMRNPRNNTRLSWHLK